MIGEVAFIQKAANQFSLLKNVELDVQDFSNVSDSTPSVVAR